MSPSLLADLRARRRFTRRVALIVVGAVIVVAGLTLLVVKRPFSGGGYEVVSPLWGNVFPSAILSVATSDAQIVRPLTGGTTLGNVKAPFAIKRTAARDGEIVVIDLGETPFYARSVSTFTLPRKDSTYLIYPDILWRYDALRANVQAEPMSLVANVSADGRQLGQQVETVSMRSINECLLGYYQPRPDGSRGPYVSTRLFYAAYVNEESPEIDKILREALNTRIVRSFLGYQGRTAESVDRQVYALWYALQRRGFRYSSVSYSSLSSNMVYAQRVRTVEDAVRSSQVNCVDGSVLFASLLRAIDITPVLVQMPGHMFVGYYTDKARTQLHFLETTMIGNVELDDYFPDERLDSTLTGMTQRQASRLTFEKSMEYAEREYARVERQVRTNKPPYLFVEISKGVRQRVQPIGK